MYTFIRTEDNARLVIPNEKLASDTIRNSTIRSAAKFAEVTVQVPPTADLRSLVEDLEAEAPGERDEVFVSALDGAPTVTAARVDRERGRGREARARPPRARARAPARARGLRDDASAAWRTARRRPTTSSTSAGAARRSAWRGSATAAAPSSSRSRPRSPLLFVVAGAAVTGVATFGSSCDLNALRPVSIGQNSFIYAANNSILGAIPAERNRQPVPLKRISPWMPKATVAIEDRRFYEHGGIDVEGIARALWKNVNAGEVVEGGSTITQQLVRNLYIGRERTVERKLKEACLAIKLNRAWSKERILATLHEPGLLRQPRLRDRGGRADVLLQARRRRSRCPRRRCSPACRRRRRTTTRSTSTEIATDAPERRAARDAQRGRRSSATQYDWAVKRELGLKAGKLYTTIREPYFFSYVRDQLIAEYGAATVRSGGLKVYTTIDPRFQRAAQKAIRETLYDRDDPAAAVISINPRNGAIRAMTAVTPGNRKNQFNLLSQARRQSGSTFKTFVLAAAVEKGINPATIELPLGAVLLPARLRTGTATDGTWWCPRDLRPQLHRLDDDRAGHAPLRQHRLRAADARRHAGGGRARWRRSSASGRASTSTAPTCPSIGLGAMDVSPLDMASAYATLAAGGIYSEPMAIRKVVLPDGEDTRPAGGSRSASA